MESPLQWLTMVVIGTVVTIVITHFELLRYAVELVRQMVWIPWTVTRHMRKQGYSLSGLRNSEKATAPMEPLLTSRGLSHDLVHRVFPHIYSGTGNKFIFRGGSTIFLHIDDPDAIKEIFSTKYNQYHKPIDSLAYVDLIGPKGLIFAEHEEWARQRRVVRSAFYTDRSKRLVVQMASWTEIWLQRLDTFVERNGGSADIDMQPQLFELNKDILARSSFGSSFAKGKDGLDHQENLKKLLLQQGDAWNPFDRWLPSAQKKEISKEKGDILSCLRQIIKERRNSIQSGNYESYGDDILGLLLADRDRRLAFEGRPPGELETDDEHILDQCRTFLFAGSDTIFSALLWATVLLGYYTDWQERIRSEVWEAFQGQSPDGERLNELKQLSMFVNETLRLYLPASVTTREVFRNDTTLLGEPLPKHLTLFVNFLALHRRKEYWGDDALEFKPERFSDGITKACTNPTAYSPFGLGPRVCVAQSWAMMELKLILAMFVQRFSFRLSPSYRHEPTFGLILAPKFGVQVVLESARSATSRP